MPQEYPILLIYWLTFIKENSHNYNEVLRIRQCSLPTQYCLQQYTMSITIFSCIVAYIFDQRLYIYAP